MDIKISIVLKDQTYGFSDLLDGRELNDQIKEGNYRTNKRRYWLCI